MQGGSIEKLVLQSGVSSELKAALELVSDNNFGGEPKYSRSICYELTKTIAGRTYGPVFLELSHALFLANHCGGQNGFAEFFWGIEVARPSAFRSIVERSTNSDQIEMHTNEVQLKYLDGFFTISYSRLPFLAAMLEFVVSFLGYNVVDEITSGIINESSVQNISKRANDLSRRLYEALKPHLPTAQVQRKFDVLTEYISDNEPGIASYDDINDDFILKFWIDVSGEEEFGDFKTFDSASRAVENFCLALEDGHTSESISRRRTIGYDLEANEVDPAQVSEGIQGVEEQEQLLDQLTEPPQNSVKFLNNREVERLSCISRGVRSALRFPKTKLRSQVFGKAQSKITHSLRHRMTGEEMRRNIENCVDLSYADIFHEFQQLSFHIEKVRLASFFVLFRARRIGAIELLMELDPELDLSELSEVLGTTEYSSDNVIPINGQNAADQIFARVMDDNDLPVRLSRLLEHSERSYKSLSRVGFRDGEVEDPITLEAHEKGIRIVTNIFSVFKNFIDKLKLIYPDDEEIEERYRDDERIFKRHFLKLYEVVPS